MRSTMTLPCNRGPFNASARRKLVFIRRPVHPAGEAYATFKKLAPSGKSPAYLHHRTNWEFSPRRDTGRGFSDWRCNDSLIARTVARHCRALFRSIS
jgi:hypothetical protein